MSSQSPAEIRLQILLKQEQKERKRIAELEAELKRLRRGIDYLKVRSYELGQRELHDAALALLEKGE